MHFDWTLVTNSSKSGLKTEEPSQGRKGEDVCLNKNQAVRGCEVITRQGVLVDEAFAVSY